MHMDVLASEFLRIMSCLNPHKDVHRHMSLGHATRDIFDDHFQAPMAGREIAGSYKRDFQCTQLSAPSKDSL
jgi:hypothetical protein